MALKTLSPYPGKDFDLATYLRQVTSKKFGVADPRTSYWGQIGQVASGQVSSSALDKYRKMQLENPLMKPGDIRSHFNRLEQESRQRKIENVKRMSAMRQAQQVSGMNPEEISDYYTRLEERRLAIPGQVLSESGKSLDDILAAQRGEGIYARQQAMFSQHMAPKQLESYREGIQDAYDIANQALWNMADLVARAKLTQATVTLPDGTPIYNGYAEINGVFREVKESDFGGGDAGKAKWVEYQNTTPATSDVQQYGEFRGFMYQWLNGWAGNLQGDPAATQLLLTSNYEFINALMSITPISFDTQIPVRVSENAGLHDPQRTQTQNFFLANGSMYDGMILDSVSGLNFSLMIPEGETWQVRVVQENGKDVIKFVNATEPVQTVGTQPVVPTVTPTPEPTVEPVTTEPQYIDGELYRIRDFSVPQYLTPEQADVYFPGIKDQAEQGDTIIVQAAADGNLAPVAVISANGLRVNYSTMEDGSFAPTEYIYDGANYTPEEWDTYITQKEEDRTIEVESYMDTLPELGALFNVFTSDSRFVNKLANGQWLAVNIVGNVTKEYDLSTAEGQLTFAMSEGDTILSWIGELGETDVTRAFMHKYFSDAYGEDQAWQMTAEYFSSNGNLYDKLIFGAANLDIADLNLLQAGNPVVNLWYNYQSGGVPLLNDQLASMYQKYIRAGYTWEYCNRNQNVLNTLAVLQNNARMSGESHLSKILGTPDVETPEILQYISQQHPEVQVTQPFGIGGTEVLNAEGVVTQESIESFISTLGTAEGMNNLRAHGPTAAAVAFLKMVNPLITDDQIIEFYTYRQDGQMPQWVQDYIIDPFVDTGIPQLLEYGSNLMQTGLWGWEAYVFNRDSAASQAYRQEFSELVAGASDPVQFWTSYAIGANADVNALVDYYAPDWTQTAGEWLNPLYLLPVGGILRFTGITEMVGVGLGKIGLKGLSSRLLRTADAGLDGTVRMVRSFVPKRFKTLDDLKAFGAKWGLVVREAPHSPWAGGKPDIIIESETFTRQFHTLQEANYFLKYGNKEAFEAPGIFLPKSKMFSFKLRRAGVDTAEEFSLYDIEKIENMLNNQTRLFGKSWYSKVKSSELYKAGDVSAINAAIIDTLGRGLIKPKDIIVAAYKLDKAMGGVGADVFDHYWGRINRFTKYAYNSMKEKNNLYIKGINEAKSIEKINGLVQRGELSQEIASKLIQNGKINRATNVVGEYAAYYVFDNPMVSDFFDNIYHFIDGVTGLAHMHGVRMHEMKFGDVLELAHYLPRRVTGKKGVDALIASSNPMEQRVFEFMSDGLAEGYYYDTMRNSIESFTKTVYRRIGREETNRLVEIFKKETASETLKGQILIESAKQAGVYAKKADEFKSLVRQVIDGKRLTGKDVIKFKDYFPYQLKELQDIVGAFQEVGNLAMLDDLILQIKGAGKLTGKQISWMKKHYPGEAALLDDLLKFRSQYHKNSMLAKLNARRDLLNVINDEINFPQIGEVIESQVVRGETRTAAITEMRRICERVLNGEKFNSGLIRDINKAKLPKYYPNLMRHLKLYDTIRSRPVGAVAGQGPAEFVINIPQIQRGADALITKLRSGSGGTINMDGSFKVPSGDYIVSIRSKNMNRSTITSNDIVSFLQENNTDVAAFGNRINIGVWPLEKDPSLVSIDINIVTKDRDRAMALAKNGGQAAVWEERTESLLRTGLSGEDPISLSISDIASYVGDMPSVKVFSSYRAAQDSLGESANNFIVKLHPTKSNSDRNLLIQIASGLQDSGGGVNERYFDLLYSGTRKGYSRPNDFWEVPTWIAATAHTVPNCDVMIVRNMPLAELFLKETDYKRVFFSVMDSNKNQVMQLANAFPREVIAGGYIKAEALAGLNNIKFFSKLDEAANYLGVPYKEGIAYDHFRGTPTVPRLCMSRGCNYHCTFCTIPKQAGATAEISPELINQQVQEIKKLKPKLVYLDDKTFGQAANHTRLAEIYKDIKADNPAFEGFIVQTTAKDFAEISPDILKASGIRYVEFGVETYNDDLLKWIGKPQSSATYVNAAMAQARANGIKVIPNIMVAIPNETKQTYLNTLNFLRSNKDIVSHVNIYTLSAYGDTPIAKRISQGMNVRLVENDLNENIIARSWRSTTEQNWDRDFNRQVVDFASEQLSKDIPKASAMIGTRRISEPMVSIDDLLDQFINKEFSYITPIRAEFNAEAKERLNNLVKTAATMKKESDALAAGRAGTRHEYMIDVNSRHFMEGTVNAARFRGWVFKDVKVGDKVIYGDRIADIIEKQFAPMRHVWLTGVNNLVRGFVTMVASIDVSAPLTFGLYLLGADLKHLGREFTFAKATGLHLGSMVSERVMDIYRTQNAQMYERYIPLGLKTASDLSDFYGGLGFLRNTVGRIPIAGKVVGELYGRSGRGFLFFGEVGRMELLKSMEKSWLIAGGSKQQLLDFVHLATCTIPRTAIQANADLALGEAIAAFAPNFLRAHFIIFARMAKGGILGRELLKIYSSSWAAWEAIYFSLWYASGQEGEPHWQPWDPEFMTMEVNGKTIGLGGFDVSFIRMLATTMSIAIENPDKLIKIGEGGWIKTAGNWLDLVRPAQRWAGYKLSPPVQFIADLATGRDAMGRRLDGAGDYAGELMKMFVPIAMQDIFLEDMPRDAYGVAASIFGLRVYPKSSRKYFYDFANNFALTVPDEDLSVDLMEKKSNGTLTWDDLGSALQNKYLNEFPDLAELHSQWKADSREFSSGDYLGWYNRSQEISQEKLTWQTTLAGLLRDVNNEYGMKYFRDHYYDNQMLDGQKWRDLEAEHRELYTQWEKLRQNDDSDPALVQVAYDEWFDVVWGNYTYDKDGNVVSGTNSFDIMGDPDYDIIEAKREMWMNRWGGDMYDIVRSITASGFKDTDPLYLKFWQDRELMSDYWKLEAGDQRDQFIKNPVNSDIEALLVFWGYRSSIVNDGVEEQVKQWCSEYNIPESKVPALAALVIPDDMMQKYHITDPTLQRQYNDLPEDGWSRKRFLVEHPEYLRYYIDELGHKEFDDDGDPIYDPAKIPSISEEAYINSYQNTDSTMRKAWRCRNQEGELALIKFGYLSKILYGSEECQLLMQSGGDAAEFFSQQAQ